MDESPPKFKGRGSQINPLGRFTKLEFELNPDADHEFRTAEDVAACALQTEFFIDDSQSIISENNSPDLPFRYSLNPYRGCEHGCSYCYARPTHEYLDLNAGIDFESRIFVKIQAPRLFREWLGRPDYDPELVMFSGVTDCYQPVERRLKLTRDCLLVALEARQPVAIVTKNALVARDLDILREMGQRRIVSVAISVTTLNQALTRVMEPRTSSPLARLRAISELKEAGIGVHALIAPVVPGLTDHEIPSLLKAVKDAGADSASYILLRLPQTVEPVFLEWLQRTHPQQHDRVLSRIRGTRGGALSESRFGIRMRGQGEMAEHISRTFKVFSRRLGLDRGRDFDLDTSQFRRPAPISGQGWLFDC